MSLITLIVTMVAGFLIGAGLLFASVRFLCKSACTFGRAAGVYLAMLVAGWLLFGLVFYAASRVIQMPAVPSLFLAVAGATLAECLVGQALLKKSVPRALLAVATPVVLLNLIGTLGLWPAVKAAEQKALQASRMNDLRQYQMDVTQVMLEQRGIWPESLAALASFPDLHSGRVQATDLEYLPEHLARAGIPAPYAETEFNPDAPFLWMKMAANEAIPVIYQDGSRRMVSRAELDAQVAAAMEIIKLRRGIE